MLSMRIGHANGYFYGRRPQAGCFATSISMTGGRSKGNAKSAQYRIVAVEHRTADAELPPMDQPIPNDFNHLHFGAGQTEAKITLPLGKHTLRLLFADFAHVPHNPPVYSEAINVTVTESGRPPKKRYKRHRRWRYY